MGKWLARGVKPVIDAMVKGALPAPEQQASRGLFLQCKERTGHSHIQ